MRGAPSCLSVSLLAAAALTGCAGTATITDRGATLPIGADAAGARLPKADLTLCIARVEDEVDSDHKGWATRYFTEWMADSFRDVVGPAAACHVVLSAKSTAFTRALTFQTPAGEPIFTIDTRFNGNQASTTKLRVTSALKQRFAAGGALHARLSVARSLPAGMRVAPSPAVVPTQGLSTADIERIAKAVQGSAPAAPAVGPAASFPASPAPRFAAAERINDLAVVVGIESYSEIASKAPYAERDADAFRAHVRALGVPERNIVLLKGSKAVRSALTKNVEGWLPRMVKPDSRVYFYFSGHGAPDVKTGQAYLVPWDGDPNFLETTAYPVAQLYKKLGELPAKQVLVAMDSCFSGAGGRSVLASGARPLVGKIDTGAVPAKITVLAASAANEISGSLDDKGHGAFTWFLLEGLNAGKTTPKALTEYLTPRVQDEARRLNRDQTPQLQGDGGWPLR